MGEVSSRERGASQILRQPRQATEKNLASQTKHPKPNPVCGIAVNFLFSLF
jgi:hypothetical protein